MPTKTKLRPQEHLRKLTPYFFDGDIDETLAELAGILTDFKEKGYINIHMDSDTEYDYGGQHDTVFNITGQRMETQEEADKRAATARKAKASRKKNKIEKLEAQEKRERTTYLRLKKKFEGS